MAWKHISAFFIVSNLLPVLAQGGDWVQFRGPNNSGVATDSQAPTQWSGAQNLAWKRTIPGYSWSSPIVVGDKLIVTTASSDKQERPSGFGGGGFGPPGGFGRPDGDGPPVDGPSRGRFGPPRENNGAAEGDGPPARGEGGRRGPFGPGGFGAPAAPPDATYRWEIHCLDRHTGEPLWSKVALERKPTIAATFGNTYASETPISDGERVYAYFGMHGLYCYDLAGRPIWHKNFGVFPIKMSWGTGSSPALAAGRLFILCDNEQESFLVALDAKTGDELWQVARDDQSNWATPFVWRNKLRTEVVAAGAKAIRSYDPANGKLLWELKRDPTDFPNVCATPVGDDEMLFVGAGTFSMSFGPLWAIKAGAGGDISLNPGQSANNHIAWSSTKAGPPLASPLLYEEHLYVVTQRGNILACYEAKTGKEVYKERLQGGRSFASSPWAYDGKIFFLDEDGKTIVVNAGPQFEILGENEIEDMFWATPAVARDALYLRGADHVYCIK